MDLSIVVVSWNTRDLLQACLSSVFGTIERLDFEVIVVDNGSSDGSLQMIAREFPDVRIVANKVNRGFAGANNQAIKLANGRHILLLNSDAQLRAGTALAMVEFLDKHPTVGVVGGMLLNSDGSFQWSYADYPTLVDETLLLAGLTRWLRPTSFPSYPLKCSRDIREVDWVSGALLMARRDAIAQVGLLDEDYFMYTEEVDWCCRMNRQGWKVVYLPHATAIHVAGGTSRRIPERKRAQIYRSKWLFQKKHRGAARAITFRALVIGLSVAKLVTWSARGAVADRDTRIRASQNVAAYQYLLSNL